MGQVQRAKHLTSAGGEDGDVNAEHNMWQEEIKIVHKFSGLGYSVKLFYTVCTRCYEYKEYGSQSTIMKTSFQCKLSCSLIGNKVTNYAKLAI